MPQKRPGTFASDRIRRQGWTKNTGGKKCTSCHLPKKFGILVTDHFAEGGERLSTRFLCADCYLLFYKAHHELLEEGRDDEMYDVPPAPEATDNQPATRPRHPLHPTKTIRY